MIRTGLLALVLAGPAGAQADICGAVWAKPSDVVVGFGTLTTADDATDGNGCHFSGIVLEVPTQYSPDWHLDSVWLRGAVLGWIAGDGSLPSALYIDVQGLRLASQTGSPQLDWLLAAQSRPNGIDGMAMLSWNEAERVLWLSAHRLDFPGSNAVQASTRVTGVDLSMTEAMQMSAKRFALIEVM